VNRGGPGRPPSWASPVRRSAWSASCRRRVCGWLIRLGIAAAVMVVSRLMLILLAGRLPEGTAKEPARFLPACVTTVRRLRSNPAVPRRANIAVGIAGLWVLSRST
jgi:hypothetical protein